METPEEWPDPELVEPELLEEAQNKLRPVLDMLADIQHEMALAITQDPSNAKRNKFWENAPEEKIMELLNHAVKTFIAAFPVATSNRINLFASVIATHSELTGDPLILAAIKRFNDEILAKLGD